METACLICPGHEIEHLPGQAGDAQRRPVDDLDTDDIAGGDPAEKGERIDILARDARAVDQDIFVCLAKAALVVVAGVDGKSGYLADHVQRGAGIEPGKLGRFIVLPPVFGARLQGGRVRDLRPDRD